MRTKGWWWPMEAAVLESAGTFRMEKAVVSTTGWQEGPVPGEGEPGERGGSGDVGVREGEEFGLSSEGWWEVLKLVYECNGMVNAIVCVRDDVIIGTGGNKPVVGMLDI
jgi:hypothetical protein